MTGERIPRDNERTTDWGGLSEMEFEDGRAERIELEKSLYEKIDKSRGIKNVFKRILMGVILAATVTGVSMGVVQNYEHESNNVSEAKNEFVARAENFVDIKSDDLSWMELVKLEGFSDIEINDHNYSKYAAYDDADLLGEEEAKGVEIDWWEGRGDIYQVEDFEADGKWDRAARIDAQTGQKQTIDLVWAGATDEKDTLTMSQVQGLFAT